MTADDWATWVKALSVADGLSGYIRESEKKMRKQVLLVLEVILLLSLVSATEAFAYVDPGSGSMLIQILVTGVVGVVFYLRKFLARFLPPFSRKKTQDQDE